MPQIHLHAEPGDYAPVVILPGDPIRATKIAARFDGGLEKTRQVNANRGLVGYTGTVEGVPVSVQVTMMGAPTTGIVVEELLMLGVQTLIRVGTTGAFAPLEIGDVVVAMSSAGWTGFANVIGDGESTAPTADLDVVLALRDAAREQGLTTHVGPIVTGDTFYGDPTPAGRDPLGTAGLSLGRDGVSGVVPARNARAREGPAGPRRVDPHRVRRPLRPRRTRVRGGQAILSSARGRGEPPRRPDDRRRARRGRCPGPRRVGQVPPSAKRSHAGDVPWGTATVLYSATPRVSAFGSRQRSHVQTTS